MYDAILFDLDDTLLRNEMNGFIDKYWGTLMPKISNIFPENNIKEAIEYSTKAMIKTKRTKKTLRDVFIREFEKITQLYFSDVEPMFVEYYENDFRHVKKVTQSIPQALDILNAAKKITENIVLATIPIFPFIAIEERMRWAGIEDFPFCMVTSFETMHACKPNPEYYCEIADMLDCSPEKCLMIGNDHYDDMIAKETGMKTFLVTDFEMRKEKKRIEPDYTGNIDDLLTFLVSYESL